MSDSFLVLRPREDPGLRDRGCEDEGAVWARGAMPGWWAAFKRSRRQRLPVCPPLSAAPTVAALSRSSTTLPSLSPHGFDSVD